ncbi:hypothetical protein ABZY81_06505 [Streptomyces sp. NPDC006514]|uniref:hypothetical protein n=1 Tax=Streptomyces sp. NPDC006514 TaxID=3154308 RepID=UPI0033B1E062
MHVKNGKDYSHAIECEPAHRALPAALDALVEEGSVAGAAARLRVRPHSAQDGWG